MAGLSSRLELPIDGVVEVRPVELLHGWYRL